MRYVAAQEGATISLGRQGENNVVTVIFSTASWPGDYGAGEFRLVHKRASDNAPYPCTVSVDVNGDVNWVVEAADVFADGFGCCQLTYIVGEAVAKSVIYTTATLKSLGEGELPEPVPSWLERVFQIGDSVEQAETIALNAEAWAIGERGGVPVPEQDETYHNSSKWWALESAESASEASQSENAALGSEIAAAQSATEAASFVGSPLVAATAAAMTNQSKVYVYTGSEAGYTSGHWYYYNGAEWTDGGVYNAVAVNTASIADIQEALFS